MRWFFIFALFTAMLFSQTLFKTLASNPSRLNPLLATDSSSGTISAYLFDGLVKYDKDAKVIGDLAKHFYFEDNKTLIFELRDDAKWHDGHTFSAKDVLFTYDLLMSNKISTPYSNDFKVVKKVEVLGPYKVRVRYKKPYYKALEIWMMGIVPEHLLKGVNNLMSAAFNQKPIGTGPYILDQMVLGKSVILKANPDYFIHKPYIDRIVFSIVPDTSTNFYMLQKGEVDINALTPIQLEKKVNSTFKKRYQIIEEMTKGYTYMGFNLKRKVFQDVRVRKAIALAIDKKALVDILFFKHGRPCYGPFMPKTFAYNKTFAKRSYDPKSAKNLLEEAGYTPSHPLTFEIATNTGNSIRLAAAEVIQYYLAKIGVKVKLRVMEWQAFLNTKVFAKDFDALILGWGLSLVPDAYSIWHSDGIKQGGFNFISYKNPAVDQMIIKAQEVVNKKALAKIYQKLFAMIVNDHPYVFLYIANDITAINKKISPIIPSIVSLEHNQIDWVKTE